MFNTFFSSCIYWKFNIPNFDELRDYVDTKENVNNLEQKWSKDCKVDTISLDLNECQHLFRPSFKLFYKFAFDKSANIQMHNPWINLYKKDYFQEIHDHKTDISSVFFINDGEDFSKFYFYNRYGNNISNKLSYLMNSENEEFVDKHIPHYKQGEVIFFPGTMLHGVTPHKSDVIRKTVSCNFEITDIL